MGAPREKLVIGQGTYGRTFTLASVKSNGMNAPATGGGKKGEFTGEEGFLAYYEVSERNIHIFTEMRWNALMSISSAVLYKSEQLLVE